MKKTTIVILAMVSIIVISLPAMAGDWVATLEREILETKDIKQAMINAEKTGVGKENILLATLSIIESHKIEDASGCAPCVIWDCCDNPSPDGSGLCGTGSYLWCVENNCCKKQN